MTDKNVPGTEIEREARPSIRKQSVQAALAGREQADRRQDAIERAAGSVVAKRRGDPPDIQDLLHKITGEIEDAERRHEAAMRSMHARIAELSGRAETAKAEAPEPVAGPIGRLEKELADLSRSVESLSEGSSTRPAAEPVPAAGGESPFGHMRGFGSAIRSAPQNIDLRSEPAPAPAPAEPARPLRPAAAPVPPASRTVSAPPKPASDPLASDPNNPWDAESAEALARIYNDELAVPQKPPVVDPIVQAAAGPVGEPQRPAAPPAAIPMPPPSAAAAAAVRVGPPPTPASAPARPVEAAPKAPVAQTADVFARPADTSPGSLKPPLRPRDPAPPAATNPVGAVPVSPPGAAPAAAAAPSRPAPPQPAMQSSRPPAAPPQPRVSQPAAPTPAASVSAADRDWLDKRFAEIAAQIEQSIKTMHPDRAIAAIGQRFDALETRIDGAIGALRTSAPQAAPSLEPVERQIGEIRQALDDLGRRMVGLDTLKSDITQLAQRLATLDKLEKGHATFASQTSATLSAMGKLVQSAVDQAKLAGAGGDPRISTLHGLIEAYMVERRENEHATVEVLQAIQGAMDGLTERVGAIEEIAAAYNEPPAPPAVEEPVAFGGRERRPGPADHATAAARPHAVRGAAPVDHGQDEPDVFDRPSRAPGGRRAEDARQRPMPAQDEIESPAAPQQARSRGGRSDMLGAARRAAVSAAQQQMQATSEAPEADERIAAPQPAPGRPKAATEGKGGFFTFEKGSGRSLHVVLLVALLAAGAGMIYTLFADRQQPPVPSPARLEKPKLPSKSSMLDGDGIKADPASLTRASARPGGMEAGDEERSAALETASAPVGAGSGGSDVVREDPGSISTGILIDSGAPKPTARDLQRFAEQQRIARLSNEIGLKAAQKTASEHAQPAAHTPDATRPEAPIESAPAVSASVGAASGLPPAQIGPMSLRVAAAKGDPSAEFEVASRFAQGKGVPKDFAKAAEWYQRAANRGSAPAQYRLGGLYERGIGVAADAARAKVWYQRAAELGNVKAMHNLAVMHTQRNGADPDYATASQWFTQAADRGLADSQFNLAILHENGMGVPRNAVEAYKWFALAAERGDGEAAKRREALEQRFPPNELATAKQAVAAWRQKPVDANANDPFAAGQAWRARNGEEGAAQAPRPAARPVTAGEADVLDLTDGTIEAQLQRQGQGAPAVQNPLSGPSTGPLSAASKPVSEGNDPVGLVKGKRKVQKLQKPADVERMLTQLGYNPETLKQARPGSDPAAPQTPPTN